MWEQVKRPMVESAKEVCSLMSGGVGGGVNNPMSVWWNDEVKAAVGRKGRAWKEVLATR